MPFPPINLHQRISSPGRELFRKKKPNVPPQTEKTNKSVGEKGGSDKDKVSTSWPSANLRNLGRKPQQETSKTPTQRLVSGQETQGKGSWLTVPRPQESSDGVRRSSSMESTTHRATRQSLVKAEGGKEIQFTLSLTPEAILVIQKRNLEKQMMAKQQKCCASADFRHRRVFPSKKTHGGSKSCIPVAKLESADQDITTIVKISLLNDQYKYDDVEYEEEDGDVDETVVRKCKEWLKGVESAAAFGKVDKFSALPHLKGYLDCGVAMRSKCKDIHQSSTLPSILDTYLLPVGVRKAEDEDKAQYWRRKVVQNRDPDQEAKARRQAQLEQRHLEAYRNMHRLRDALHRRYAALLREKIQSQRLESQQRQDTATTKPQNETKQKQSKLAFSMLQHNDSYLRSLPKTSYYLILDLQNQLAQRGCLKRHQDLEDFYRCINYNYGPSQLQRSLQDIRRKMVGSRSAADLMTQQKTRGSPRFPISAGDGGHADQVSRSRPPSRSSVLKRGSGSGESSADPLLHGSQEQEETEQMFPKMKVPTFGTLQPNFLRNVQSKMPQLIIPEIPEKSRKAGIYLRRLRQMHDISLTNMAFSKRLLDRGRDSLCWQEERSVPDLVPCVFPRIDSKQGKTGQADQPLHPLKQSRSGQNDRPQSGSRMTSASHQCLETIVWNTSECCRKTPDPLSMEDVCQQKSVEILDHGFKLWSNYTEDTDF